MVAAQKKERLSMSDYVYRNHDDSIRIRIFCRARGKWDFDVFEKSNGGHVATHCLDGATSFFKRKKDALTEAANVFGELMSINPKTISDGWENDG